MKKYVYLKYLQKQNNVLEYTYMPLGNICEYIGKLCDIWLIMCENLGNVCDIWLIMWKFGKFMWHLANNVNIWEIYVTYG